jgi:hypothetical protein
LTIQQRGKVVGELSLRMPGQRWFVGGDDALELEQRVGQSHQLVSHMILHRLSLERLDRLPR